MRDAAALVAFLEDARARLLAAPGVSDGLRAAGIAPTADQAYSQLIEEAATTVALIRGHVTKAQTLLEVGGGVGLANAWLQHEGYDVTSLEPGETGHGSYFATGKAILATLGLDTTRWVNFRADEAPKLGRAFDVVFSNNVLEHVANLDESMAALRQVLAPGGLMRHNCPNYLVPYEPHFGIPLVPLLPRLVEKVWPRLRGDELWRSINFITAPRIRRVARANGLQVAFDRGHVHHTFERLVTEPAFRAKHAGLARAYGVMKALRLDGMLRLIPETLATPMQLTMRPAAPREDARSRR